MTQLRDRIRRAWQGRVSGCQLGKPVEALSMLRGHSALTDFLRDAGAYPLRDYIPLAGGSLPASIAGRSCLERLCRSEPDDDINYTLLALILLETLAGVDELALEDLVDRTVAVAEALAMTHQ